VRWLDGPKLEGCARISIGTGGENTLLRHTLAAAVPIRTPPPYRGRADLLTAYLYDGPRVEQTSAR
jgi:hypothetical protein